MRVMKKWMPGAHSFHRLVSKFSTCTVSPFLYVKSVSYSLYAVVSGGRLLPCLSCRSSTRAVLARHLRPVPLERCASAGMRSFTMTGFGGIVSSTYAFFQPMMSLSSGRMLVLAMLSSTWLASHRSASHRSASHRLAPCRSAPRRSAPCRQASHRSAWRRSAPRRSAPHRLAPCRLAPCRLAPCRSAPCRQA